jgi:hypothetical protein
MALKPLVQLSGNKLIGRGYKTRFLNPHDELWDRRLGVHTFGFRPASGNQDTPDWRLHYVPSSYRDIFFLLRHVGLNGDDVLTDLGAGMGRAVFAASWMGAKCTRGVDILPDLCEIAENNRRKGRLANRDISFSCQNAKDVDLTGTTVIFIFHSFGGDTLRAVLQNAERVRDSSRPLRIIYMNPVFNEILEATPWLKGRGLVRAPRRFLTTMSNYHAAIWEAA